MKKKRKGEKMFLVQLKRGGHFNSISVLYGDRWRIQGDKVAKQTDKQHIGQSTSKNID